MIRAPWWLKPLCRVGLSWGGWLRGRLAQVLTRGLPGGGPGNYGRGMTRKTPPFRADHVGSLLRPAALLEARARHAAGEIDADELRDAEDAAIRQVVRMQEDVGL